MTIIAEQTHTTACQTGGTWSTELNLSTQPDGTVQVYVSQTDAVGNIGDDTKNLTKDTIVPIADFDTLLTKVKSPKLTGLVNDTTATVQVKVAGKTYDADNNGNGTWKLDAGDIDPELTSGTYTVSVIVTDSALNTETYDFASALIVDATNPVITINPPTKLSNKNIDNIVITVTDNNGILAEDVSINSSSTGGPTNLVCTQSGTKKVNCTVMITKSGNLIINAVDEATNSASKMEDNFVIDRILPVVSITSDTPINNSNKTSYTLEGTCTEGDGDITINTAGQTYQTECQTEGIWSESLDLFALTEGNISIQASQTDAAGNKGTFTKNLLKDTEAPTVTINQSSTQADPTNINSVKYTVVFSEKINKDTFTNADILISGSTTAKVKGITEISDTEYEVEIDNLTDGNTITAIIPADAVTDLAGNGNTESTGDDYSVTYDITQPTVTVNQAVDQADPTNVNEIKFTIVFSEPINGDTFAKDDLEVSGSSTATVFQLQTVSSTTYTAIVTGMLSGETISLSLPADAVTDLAGNGNTESTGDDKSVTYDSTQPTVTVNQADDQADPTNVNDIKFTIVFSEPINGDTFVKEDLEVSGSSTATVSQLQTVSSTTYTAIVTGMISGETVSLTLPANKVEDMAGNQNEVSTFTDNSVTYTVDEEEPEQPDEPEKPEEPEEEPTKPVPPTPLDPKPVVKLKSPITKYIAPVVEQLEETTPSNEEKTSETTKKPTTPTQSKSLRIKVYNESREPLKGVTVEIHSDVRTGITDENGEVYFENLDTGLHTMVIAYNEYRAEKKINLVSDGEEEMEINIKLEKVIIPNYVYWLIALIVLLTILSIYLGYRVHEEKRNNEEK